MRWRLEITIAVLVRLVRVDEDKLQPSPRAHEQRIARAHLPAARQRVLRAEGIAV